MTGERFFPVLECNGNPFDNGYAHGRQAVEAIAANVELYVKLIARCGGFGRAEALAAAGRFAPIIEAYDREIWEEIRGIAAGSGRPVEEVLALNVRRELTFGQRSGCDGCACTALAVLPSASASGHTIVAQNWDYAPGLFGACVILAVTRPGRPKVVTFTEAGMVGKIGFNSAGLGMTCNLLITDRDRRDIGVPMHVLLRKVLNDAETVGEAIGLIGKTERASSLNYLLAHRDGAAMDVEGAPDVFDVLAPEAGRIAHTNHFVGPRLAVTDLSWTVVPDSYVRLWRARALLREKGDRLHLKDLQEIFRDHVNRPDSICRHADPRDPEVDRMETLASLIIDLEEQTLHITCGTPCSNEYRTLNFG